MDELLKLFAAFNEEFALSKQKINEYAKLVAKNPLDIQLKQELEAAKAKAEELEVFLKETNENVIKTIEIGIKKDPPTADITNLASSVRGDITNFIQNWAISVIGKMTIDKMAFDIADQIIKALDLSSHAPAGMQAYIADKFAVAGKAFVDSLVPFADEIIKIASTIFPTKVTLPKARINEAVFATIQMRILEQASDKMDIISLLQDHLSKWIESIITDNTISLADKKIKLTIFRSLLSTVNMKHTFNLENEIKTMLFVALRELFEKANTTIVQVCPYTNNPLDNEAVEKGVIVKTKFSNDDTANKLIYTILSDMGIPVNNDCISTDILRQIFPISNIVFQGDGDAPNGLDKIKFNHNESIGNQYANARADLLKREAEERAAKKRAEEKAKLQKEEAIRLAKIKEYQQNMGIDPEEEAKKKAEAAKVLVEMNTALNTLEKNQKGKNPLWMDKKDAPTLKIGQTIDIGFNYNFGVDIINENIIANSSGQYELLAKHLKSCTGLKKVQVYIAIANPMGGKVLTSTSTIFHKFVQQLTKLGVNVEFVQIGDIIHRQPAPQVKEPLGIFLSLK